MKLRTLLSGLLLPAIFLSTDAKAAGHPHYADGAAFSPWTSGVVGNIEKAFEGPLMGRLLVTEDTKEYIDTQLAAFLKQYDATPAAHRGGLLSQLAVTVADIAGSSQNKFERDKIHDLVNTMITFLQTNFVDRGIKVGRPGGLALKDVIKFSNPTVRDNLKRLADSNDALPA